MTGWNAADLRLTAGQAATLRTGTGHHHYQRVADRMEIILKSRGMLEWRRQPNGTYSQVASAKGREALKRYDRRSAR